MKKKILIFVVLLILMVCLLSLVFASPAPVTNLKAKGEIGQVRVSWTGSSQAEGYILYRKVGSSGNFSYLSITSNQGSLDKKASVSQWNFYRVYPYKMVNGKRVVGISNTYVYAKAIKPSYNGAVTGLKARPNLGHNTISWNKVTGADGYGVFRFDINTWAFKHLKNVEGSSYDDFDLDPREYDNEFYRVYPFKRINEVNYFGKSTGYVYAKAELYSNPISELRGYRHPRHSNGTVFLQWKKADGVVGYAVRKTHLYSKKGSIVAYTTNTAIKLTDIEPFEENIYEIHPFIHVKGRRVLGEGEKVIIRAYGKPGEYYSGQYKVGTDIAEGTYEILSHATLGSYSIYRNGMCIVEKTTKFGNPPIIEDRLQKGDILTLIGSKATKQ